ncbi:MAG: chromate transporter [Clostridiales bacterium]|nr:chromate transporter [Clostridiales bacterium]
MQLFTVFFKIGAFTFGGGYAMIPLIQKETVENKKWITDDDILEIMAIAESTPGPIAVNSATFVGYRVCGVFGALMSTIGVVLPSFIIISLISLILNQFQELRVVKYAFFGIRAGVLALLVKALWTMFKKCPKGIVPYTIAVAAFIISGILGVNVLIVIVGCAAAGLVASLINAKKSDGGAAK